MKKIYFLFFIVLLGFWMTGCKSASKLYEKGKYDEAVQVAVKKLQKDPNDAKLRSIVQDAYRYAVNDHENVIRSYAEDNNELKWEWIYNEYADLQRLYDAIYKSPVVYELVQPVDYSSSVVTYAEKDGEMHIERGAHWMDQGGKQSYKNAYHEFQAAMRFKQGDITIQQMINEAYDAAVTRVVIMPVDDYGYRFSSYDYNQQNLDNDVIRDLQYNSGNEFVKFYSARDAQSRNIIADQVLEMRFNSINIGRIQDNRNSREVSKEVVIKETVYRPDSIVKEYARVKAKITTTKRTMFSEGNMAISLRDNNGQRLWSDNIQGTHGWSTEFSTYTGDERALSDEDKKLMNTRQEIAPREEDILKCIRENIYNDLVCRVRNYYNRY